MRKQRVLSFVLSCFIICSIICGPTFASGISVLEDMDIDPWADLEQLPDPGGFLPTFQIPEPPEEPQEDAIGEGIVLYALPPGGSQDTLQVVKGGFFITPSGNASQSLITSGLFTAPSFSATKTVTAGYNKSTSAVAYVFGVNAGTEIHYTKDYSSPSLADKGGNRLVFTGTVSFSYCGKMLLRNNSAYGPDTAFVYPTSIRLVVNDILQGEPIPISSSKTFDLTDISVNIPASGITSFGFRVYFENSVQTNQVSFAPGYYADLSADFYCNFNANSLDYEIMPPVDTSQEALGLLGGIIEFLKSILTGITNIGTAIIELPGKIVTALIDGLKSLFIPSDADLKTIASKYNGLFEQKLGFVYQLFTFVVDTFTQIKNTLSASQDYSFQFPGISFPMNGEIITILPAQAVSLDNPAIAVIRPILGTAVSIVCVLAFLNVGFDLVIAFMSGKSYFDFLKKGDSG